MNERKHVNGFRPLRPEEKWYRNDLNPNDYPTGYRPMLDGEPYTEYEWWSDDRWRGETRPGSTVCRERTYRIRTRLPLPTI